MASFFLIVFPLLLYGLLQAKKGGWSHLLAGGLSALLVASLFFLTNRVIIISLSSPLFWVVMRVLIEEAGKVAALRLSSPAMHLYTPAIGVGLAFAGVEHLLYVSFFPQSIVLRLLITTPLHISTLLLFIFLKKQFCELPAGKRAIPFLAAVLLHLAFNQLV